MIDLGVLKTISITEIEYDLDNSGRIEGSFSDESLEDLTESIMKDGLINPVTVYSPSNNPPYKLLAGHRRLMSCKRLKMSEISVRVYNREISDIDLLAIRLHENTKRSALLWTEEVRLKERLHNSLVEEKGEKIARSPNASGHSEYDTANILGESQSATNQDLRLAKALAIMPSLYTAKNKHEARKILRRVSKEVINAKIVQAREEVAKASEDTSLVAKIINSYIVGDFFDNDLQSESFDLIECDPPYGLDLKNLREHPEFYMEDYTEISEKDYSSFFSRLCRECYRLASLSSWIIMWHKPQNYQLVIDELSRAGFNPCFVPCIWKKGNSPGQTRNPDTYLGHGYEQFIYARKGSPTIKNAGRVDVYDFPLPTNRIHATEKPALLMHDIIQTFHDRGSILVPFAGSGVTLREAIMMNFRAVGYDLSQNMKNAFAARVMSDPIFKQLSFV